MDKEYKPQLLFPQDYAGTLCARDGIKTGPHTPNGEDAYDRKLIVTKIRRKSRRFYSNHQTTSDVQEVEIAPCMGASRNLGPSNNNPLVVTCYSNPQDHSVTRGFMTECAPTLNAAAGMSGNNRPFIVKSKAYGCISKGNGETILSLEKSTSISCGGGQLGQGRPAVLVTKRVVGGLQSAKKRDKSTYQETGQGYWMELGISSTLRAEGENRPSRHSNVVLDRADKKKIRAIAVLDRCGNNWKNGKGGCGPLLHKEYAPTVATMFQPFVVRKKG